MWLGRVVAGVQMYLGRCALNYAHLSGERAGDVTSSFNGLFFSVFQFCPFIGQARAAADMPCPPQSNLCGRGGGARRSWATLC